MTRQENIDYDFLMTDRIWPPGIAPTIFVNALVEVLRRLPHDAYEVVSELVSFVVEDPRITAVNVPFNRVYPASSEIIKVRCDTIVVFHQALDYSHAALVGLLAHELAHSFVSGPDYKTDEQTVNNLAQQWGFDRELEALRTEQQKAKQGT